MKKYKIIIALTCLILANFSCNEDALELSSPNKLSPETFFKTVPQVQSAVNAAYVDLESIQLYTRNMFFMMDNMAQENAGNPQLADKFLEFLDFSFDSSSGDIKGYWDSCFRGINKANFVIGNEDAINEIEDAVLSPENKAKFVGEAKFMRAFYYFMLVTRFGDVPLFPGIIEDGSGRARSPKEEVYTLIISDLQSASTTLLAKASEQTGRATKGAASALLGKVYLYQQNYSAALAEFNKVTGYSLDPIFENNFLEATEHGVESIFEIEFNDEERSRHSWRSDASGTAFAGFRGKEYGWKDWFNVYPSDDLLDEFEAGDPRYAITFYSTGDTYFGGTVTIPQERRAGWRKYQNYNVSSGEDTSSGINFNAIRYADVLLMMAECANEVSSQSEAAGYVNEVRARVGMPAISTNLSKSEMFAAIVHERKVELAGEQIRFADIIRWGNASTELSGSNFVSGKHELFPIPDAEMSSNENINSADQNPGY